jgi:hypothetical protein
MAALEEAAAASPESDESQQLEVSGSRKEFNTFSASFRNCDSRNSANSCIKEHVSIHAVYPSLSLPFSLCVNLVNLVFSTIDYAAEALCEMLMIFFCFWVPWNSWTQLSGTED